MYPRKLTEAQVVEIRRDAAAGEFLSDLARRYGVIRLVILYAVRGNTYADVPGAIPDYVGRKDRPNGVKGERSPVSVLTDADVRWLRAQALWRHDGSALARAIGVSRGTAICAIRGQTWAHLPGAIPDWESNGCKGEANHFARFVARDIQTMRAMVAAGWSQGQVARRYQIDIGHISRIVSRKTWAHIGDPDRPISVPSPPPSPSRKGIGGRPRKSVSV